MRVLRWIGVKSARSPRVRDFAVGVSGFLVVALLATTGLAGAADDDVSAFGNGSYYAEGLIENSSPVSATDTEFNATRCLYPPESQGADAWIFELPAGLTLPAPYTAKGTTASPDWDLDVYFYKASGPQNTPTCTGNGVDANPPPPNDEEGEIPAGTKWVVVHSFSVEPPAPTEVLAKLCVGDPKGCVASSPPSSNGSESPPTSPATSPPGGEGEITTTLQTSKATTDYREKFTLSGQVNGDQVCGNEGDYTVGVGKRVKGKDKFPLLDKTAPVKNDGSWELDHRSSRSADYVAQVSGSATCDGKASKIKDVNVRALVVRRGHPAQCKAFNLLGQVVTKHPGTMVELERETNNGYNKIDEDKLDNDSHYVVEVPGCGVYRVRWPSQAPTNATGVSKRLVFEV